MAPTSLFNRLPKRSLPSEADFRFGKIACLFGLSANWVCLSFMVMQAWIYFRHSKKDTVFLRAIGCTVILFQLVETGLYNYSTYNYDVAGEEIEELMYYGFLNNVFSTQYLLVSLTGFIVQCFFIWRIWTFTIATMINSHCGILFKVTCAFILLTSGLSLSAGVITGFESFISGHNFITNWFNMLIVIWGISSASADMIITICMTALLLHAKAGSYFGETRDLLSRLIRLIWQTGFVTAVLALLIVPLYVWGPPGINLIPISLLGKTTVISLLVNLNARTRSNALVVHRSGNNQESHATQLSTLVFSPSDHRREEEDIDSINTSNPVNSTVEKCSQCQRPTNSSADISGEQGVMESPV